MRRLPTKIILLLTTCLLLLTAPATRAREQDKLKELEEQIRQYEEKLGQLSGQKKTLSATLTYLNTQISLTQSQIKKTQQELVVLEKEIKSLNTRIDQLNISLNDLSTVLIHRVRSTYTQTNLEPIYFFLSSRGFTDLINRYKYLQAVQNHDKKILLAMERSRANYGLQKTLKEQKQAEIEALNATLKRQQSSLTAQQHNKQVLLEQTKNDEKRYQELLTKSRAELEAIQAIVAGRGEETEVGNVNTGDKIAAYIIGPSACSTGGHVHFEIAENGTQRNPASFLKNKDINYTTSDRTSFTGDLEWPINDPVTVSQIYGATEYTKSGALWYQFHTGIDMYSSSNTVKAIKNGKLFRGGIACGGGTLRYVKVEHDNGLSSYYLHVNYI